MPRAAEFAMGGMDADAEQQLDRIDVPRPAKVNRDSCDILWSAGSRREWHAFCGNRVCTHLTLGADTRPTDTRPIGLGIAD